jgi:hypothetical protein
MGCSLCICVILCLVTCQEIVLKNRERALLSETKKNSWSTFFKCHCFTLLLCGASNWLCPDQKVLLYYIGLVISGFLIMFTVQELKFGQSKHRLLISNYGSVHFKYVFAFITTAASCLVYLLWTWTHISEICNKGLVHVTLKGVLAAS